MNKMVQLPDYLLERISYYYKTKKSQKYVIEKLSSHYSESLNVGIIQFVDCILFIANGDIEEIDKIFRTNLHNDFQKLVKYAMKKLPVDIFEKINSDYKTREERNYVIKKFSTLFSESLNVGIVQLIGSILVIADGKIDEIDRIFESNFHGDPRDLIMYATERIKNETFYGINHIQK
jgi:hypothetical protein